MEMSSYDACVSTLGAYVNHRSTNLVLENVQRRLLELAEISADENR
jgi:hypothetical protein